jgi:hypothetical protein
MKLFIFALVNIHVFQSVPLKGEGDTHSCLGWIRAKDRNSHILRAEQTNKFLLKYSVLWSQ